MKKTAVAALTLTVGVIMAGCSSSSKAAVSSTTAAGSSGSASGLSAMSSGDKATCSAVVDLELSTTSGSGTVQRFAGALATAAQSARDSGLQSQATKFANDVKAGDKAATGEDIPKVIATCHALGYPVSLGASGSSSGNSGSSGTSGSGNSGNSGSTSTSAGNSGSGQSASSNSG